MKILVPISLTEDARGMFAVATTLAQKCGGMLVLLHVVQLNIVGEERGIPRARLLNESRRWAMAQLAELAGRARTEVPVKIIVAEGSPAEVIVETAENLAANVIVMSTHGHGVLTRWLHRNTRQKVVKRAPCPVWLPASGGDALALILAESSRGLERPRGAGRYERPRTSQRLLRVLIS